MARNRHLTWSQTVRFILFFGIATTIISYVYDNVFIVAHLSDIKDDMSMEITMPQNTQSIHNHIHNTLIQPNIPNIIMHEQLSSFSNSASSENKHLQSEPIIIPSIPALIIIGPPKAGTTSLTVNLAKYFPNWYHQTPQRENGHWYSELRMKVTRNLTRYRPFYNTLHVQIENMERGEKMVKISQFDFDSLLTDEIWPHSSIINVKREYIATLLNKTRVEITNKTHIMEKTAFNFYLFHLALAFGKYFSSPQFGTYSIGNQLYSHKQGTKLVAILRDPAKRLISWHSMKLKFKSKWRSMDYYILNLSRNDSFVMEFREMIINRKNEYDDTLIMLKYIQWLYKFGNEGSGPWANVWLGRYMLLCGVDYPVFLFWIYAYKQMGLQQHFKVIGFNYMVKHFKEVMLGIRCWVQDGITDQMECDRFAKRKYIDIDKEVVLEHKNKFARMKSDAVLEYMDVFYKPLKHQTSELVKRTGVILGVWDDSDVMTSW